MWLSPSKRVIPGWHPLQHTAAWHCIDTPGHFQAVGLGLCRLLWHSDNSRHVVCWGPVTDRMGMHTWHRCSELCGWAMAQCTSVQDCKLSKHPIFEFVDIAHFVCVKQLIVLLYWLTNPNSGYKYSCTEASISYLKLGNNVTTH